MPEPILKEVTYGEGMDILKDDGSGAFEAPHWKDDREVQYPYLYKGGNRITVAEVKWLLPDCELEGPFYASGEGNDENSFDEVQATSEITEEGTVVTANNLYSSISSLDNETKFFDPFEIQWKLRHGSGNPIAAGNCISPVYICLEEGSLASDKRFYAVVHIACGEGGATTPDQAFAKTWGVFESRTVKWRNWVTGISEPLYYYRKTPDGQATTFAQNATKVIDPGNPPNGLLTNSGKTGQCSAWAELLAWCLLLNCPASGIRIRGIESSREYSALFMKAWSVKPGSPGLPLAVEFPNSVVDGQHPDDYSLEMIPEPSSKTYGALINDKAELKGQNTAPPSQKAFLNHVVVVFEFNGVTWICDPSYGKKYSSLGQMQTEAVQFFGWRFKYYDEKNVHRWGVVIIVPPPNQVWLRFK